MWRQNLSPNLAGKDSFSFGGKTFPPTLVGKSHNAMPAITCDVVCETRGCTRCIMEFFSLTDGGTNTDAVFSATRAPKRYRGKSVLLESAVCGGQTTEK